jgi:hypothetical protein
LHLREQAPLELVDPLQPVEHAARFLHPSNDAPRKRT